MGWPDYPAWYDLPLEEKTDEQVFVQLTDNAYWEGLYERDVRQLYRAYCRDYHIKSLLPGDVVEPIRQKEPYMIPLLEFITTLRAKLWWWVHHLTR